MSSLVVDASVVVKWFVKEDNHEKALRLIDTNAMLIAPQLLLTEVANALCRRANRGEYEPAEVERALTELPTMIMRFGSVGQFLPEAVRLAIAHRHPIYDFLYLLLAIGSGATMVTADRRFVDRLRDTPLARHIVLLADWRPQ